MENQIVAKQIAVVNRMFGKITWKRQRFKNKLIVIMIRCGVSCFGSLYTQFLSNSRNLKDK